jgi:hypothetical protein
LQQRFAHAFIALVLRVLGNELRVFERHNGHNGRAKLEDRLARRLLRVALVTLLQRLCLLLLVDEPQADHLREPQELAADGSILRCGEEACDRTLVFDLAEEVGAGCIRRQQRDERLVTGRDVRHQVLRGALSVKVHGNGLPLRGSRPSMWCESTEITESGLAHTPIP